jgi:hypothetical protein
MEEKVNILINYVNFTTIRALLVLLEALMLLLHILFDIMSLCYTTSLVIHHPMSSNMDACLCDMSQAIVGPSP